ncbi:hypothetical protein niasHS_007916 [Heterodera schachtii]|uniref:B30.2/SPRY domain-containing protein n=1 Tax=Heterodera schachtii TaxID=97005 RepID=A0ABD2JQ68_HETSC
MSLSIGSSSYEDDFTSDQPEINAEVNGPSITSWTIITENPTKTDSSAQQQQRQVMRMLALCHGESKQQKFQCQIKKMTIDEEMKQQKVMAQHILLLQEKVAKIEKEKEEKKKKINEKYGRFGALLGRTIELEEEQKQQKVKENGTATTINHVEQLMKMQNNHFALLERISVLEKQQLKEQKQQDENYDNEYDSEQFTKLQNDQQQTIVGETSELEKGQQKMSSNCWDANFCDSDLEIIGTECLTVRHNGDVIHGYRSVCAKHPIFLLKNDQNDSANSFYFEISIKNMKDRTAVGFIAQKQMALDEYSYALNGSYAWLSNGILWKNGSNSIGTDKGCYGAGDTVGCGIDLANRKIFFTKNGIRLDTADLRLYLSIPSDIGQLFPFVSLCESDDKIETNFGPNFIAITPTTSKIVPINPEIVSTMLTTMTSIITPINLVRNECQSVRGPIQRIKLKTIRPLLSAPTVLLHRPAHEGRSGIGKAKCRTERRQMEQ